MSLKVLREYVQYLVQDRRTNTQGEADHICDLADQAIAEARRTPSVSPSAEARELVKKLQALIALKRGASLHKESETEALWLEEAATFIERTAAPGVAPKILRDEIAIAFCEGVKHATGYKWLTGPSSELAGKYADERAAALSSPKEGGESNGN